MSSIRIITIVGARPQFIKAAADSTEAVAAEIEALTTELRVAMFVSGARDLQSLREPGRLIIDGP
jgi:isopentenyl diphosphate isomerase/L-lactate dehydrogenase-like FMN-dependent dehydrogenase